MKLLSRLFFVNLILLISGLNSYPQVYKVVESGTDHLIVEFNFGSYYAVVDTSVEGRTYQKIRGEDYSMRNPGDPWVPEFMVLAGIPFDSKPNIKIIEQRQSVIKNRFIIPYPEEDPAFVKQDFEKINKEIYSKNELFPASPANFNEIYVVRYVTILPIAIAPYQFNPVTRDLVFNSYLKVRIDFNTQIGSNIRSLNDDMTDEFLKSSVVNYQEAQSFTGMISSGDSPAQQNDYWFNPNKNYIKIYVKQKNVYRVTYQELISAGAQLGSSTSTKKLEMFNNGVPVPIEVFDTNDDSLFNTGDYLQFVGYPAKESPYCKTNIYNLTNVYWFSYQSDSSGVFYLKTPSFVGNYTRSYFTNLTTLHFERDSLYTNLGYAPDDMRDFWLWDRAASRNGSVIKAFGLYFDTFPKWYNDSTTIRLRIAMQGIMNSGICPVDHKAYVIINNRAVGDIAWNGQDDIIFSKTFHASPDSIPIYPGNDLIVEVRGDVCSDVDDEIRVNWVEFEYWRANSVLGKYFSFINSDYSGINRYPIFDWQGSDMRIYIPTKNRMMYIPNTSNFEQFTDTMTTKTEYFLVSSDYSAAVDSLVSDFSSDLRNTNNGADYIIITHQKFKDIANQLADLRSTNFPDENIPSPRIKIVDVQEIYDEFSFGLLEPSALRSFVQYAFENWELPAPSYVVLLGDMSYDYRALLASSRPNFVPSIPFFSYTYGLAASDNLIVCVAGNDAAPDLAIGRLSIETVAEGNVLLQKLTDYPDDPGKQWKQNVLLLASGLSLQDEIQFGFNDASLFLGNTYVKPNGYFPSYVFRYPSKPEHEPYQGEGPKIREEINKGSILVNYYGHGGGYQWDLVFTNDDIYLLENEGRLPLVLSVTCYTAHFENQDVFGEQFNKVSGKGSIGFYGSAGLTYWGIGTNINRQFFDEVFNLRNFITGKAIMNSKNRVPSAGLYGIQLNMLTYLGDPVLKLALPNYPDFELNSNDITLIPENPLIGDSVQVKINITNLGTIFPNDSVVVELYAELPDTNYQIGLIKRPSFGERDSVYFPWVPDRGGLYRLTAKVNETDIIMEEDHSDNIGSLQVIIFNISEPNILAPIDGFVSTANQVEFVLSDIGYYLPKELRYFIQIDTSQSFNTPLISSGEIIPNKSHVKWNAADLPLGIYFWRARIFDGVDYGNWSPIRSFSLMNEPKSGYYAHGEILKTFGTYNINYSEENKSLSLNTAPLPAKPNNKTHLLNFTPEPELPDSLKLTTITTDGTYIYFANIWFYARELTDGMSMIYKVGTGNNGTVEGQFYGPLSSFRDTVLHSIVCHSDGYLYAAIGKPYNLVRINTANEEIDTITIPVGILNNDNATLTNGPQFLTSDGMYIYNIAKRDSLGNQKYTLRTFDPSNNWSLAKADINLFGTSYDDGFTGFFVHGERIYTSDYYNNYMRRHNLNDGFFEEEWLASEPMPSNFKHYFAWCQDWQHDKIYASVFKYADTTVVPKFGKFAGYYVDANGSITTKQVGPVAWWNNLKYDLINPSPTGVYSTSLLGQNSSTKNWDTLQVNISDSLSLSEINPDLYTYLRLKFDLIDSTFQTTEPMEVRSVQFDYQPLSDLYVEREDFNFQQDSLLQGYPVTFDFKARNFGDVAFDSLKLNFYLNGLDSLIYSPVVRVPGDSSSTPVEYTVDTRGLLFENEVTVFGEQREREYFYFNNLTDQKFFVARDSVRPVFDVKFDGLQIIDNDIVSATPEVVITLEDNSPLPLDTTLFTIVHNNKPLRFYQPGLSYNYDGPGTPFVITWKPTLNDGRQTLEVLAKDKSGNFFDSTSYRVIFYVFNENDITDIYNYPNPFARSTHFTFILKGQNKPDELDIKIYTIAGRLIRDIKLTPTDL
ncbi:MAG: C25 family cysteine peptidase, partial [Ignavibacteriaceae bacterium]|nr:C25 family cysteine peptidase [Ignavibacteriaceae bacterium]